MTGSERDPPSASPRRRPPPPTPADAVASDAPPRPPPPPTDADAAPRIWTSLIPPRTTSAVDLGLRFVLVRDSIQSEDLEVVTASDVVEISTIEFHANSRAPPRLVLVRDSMESEDLEVPGSDVVEISTDEFHANSRSFPRAASYFISDSDFEMSALPSGWYRKIIELIGRYIPIFPPVPPVQPTPPTNVGPPLFSIIRSKYVAVFESVKGVSAYVKNLAESCIKNQESIRALESRLANVEEQLSDSIKVARTSLETAKESLKIQQEMYALLKQRLEHLSHKAKESKNDCLKRDVDKPKSIFTIIGTIVGYVEILLKLNDVIVDIFGKIPPEAEDTPKELEDIISTIESIEIRESSYALIGGFTDDVLTELYTSDVFSLVAQDSCLSVTSVVKRTKDVKVHEVAFETVLNDLEVKVVTDMQSIGMISVAGDVSEGLQETLSFSIPDKITQMGLRHQNVYGGCCALLAARPTETLRFSGIFGLKAFSLGFDVALDASSRSISRYEGAAGFDNNTYSASISLSNRCDLLRGTIARKVWPGTSVAAEATYTISTGKKSLWLGVSHRINDAVLVKAKVSADTEAAAVVQYNWTERSSISLSCHAKYRDDQFQSRFGVSFRLMG